MRKRSSLLVTFAATAALSSVASAQALGADIYLVYSGRDRARMSSISAMIPSDWNVKHYNIDLLALADYTGKQKVAAKMKRADFIVFINERAGQPFEESLLSDAESLVLQEESYAIQIEQLIRRSTQP